MPAEPVVPPMVDAKALDRLREDVGVWDATVTFWFTPDARPVKSRCTLTNRMALDGMFLETSIDGGDFGPEMANNKWSSKSFTGYNTTTRQYEAVRLSSSCSTMIVVRGRPTSDRLELSGEYQLMGMSCAERDVQTGTDDTRTIATYLKFGDAPEFMGVEMVLKRRK